MRVSEHLKIARDRRREGGKRPPPRFVLRIARAFSWVRSPGGYGLCALGAGVLAVAVAAAVPLTSTVARAVSGNGSCALIDAPQPQPCPEVTFLRAPDVPSPDADEVPTPEQTVPRVEWRGESLLRRAAGVLMLDGDYDGAMDLLAQVDAKDARAFAADRGSHRKVLQSLHEALVEEWRALRAFWAGLDERSRAGLFGRAERDMRAAFTGFLLCPPREVSIPRCASSLPERVLLAFARNVHVRLARRTGAADSLVALVVGLAFPQRSAAADLYWRSFPTRPARYRDLVAVGSRS